MRIIVNKTTIAAKGKLTLDLPERCGTPQFKVVSQPVIEYEVTPGPDSDTIYLVCVNTHSYKIVFGRTPFRELALKLVENFNTLRIVASCPGTLSLAQELCRKYSERSDGNWIFLTCKQVEELKSFMIHELFALAHTPGSDGARSRPVLFSDKAVLSGVVINPDGISTKRKSSNLSYGNKAVRVPDYSEIIDSIDLTKLSSGKYDVEELKHFLRGFNVDFQSDRLPRETLETMLICFFYAYQGKIVECDISKLRNFLNTFGFKVTESYPNILTLFLQFTGLKNVISVDIGDLPNMAQKDIDTYIDFFGVSDHVGTQDKGLFLQSHLNNML